MKTDCRNCRNYRKDGGFFNSHVCFAPKDQAYRLNNAEGLVNFINEVGCMSYCPEVAP